MALSPQVKQFFAALGEGIVAETQPSCEPLTAVERCLVRLARDAKILHLQHDARYARWDFTGKPEVPRISECPPPLATAY